MLNIASVVYFYVLRTFRIVGGGGLEGRQFNHSGISGSGSPKPLDPKV